MINTKTKGELGRRIEYDVEHDLFHPQNVYSDEYITPTFIEYVQKLEQENAELKILVSSMLYEINALWDISEMNEDVRKHAERVDSEVEK